MTILKRIILVTLICLLNRESGHSVTQYDQEYIGTAQFKQNNFSCNIMNAAGSEENSWLDNNNLTDKIAPIRLIDFYTPILFYIRKTEKDLSTFSEYKKEIYSFIAGFGNFYAKEDQKYIRMGWQSKNEKEIELKELKSQVDLLKVAYSTKYGDNQGDVSIENIENGTYNPFHTEPKALNFILENFSQHNFPCLLLLSEEPACKNCASLLLSLFKKWGGTDKPSTVFLDKKSLFTIMGKTLGNEEDEKFWQNLFTNIKRERSNNNILNLYAASIQ